MTVTDCQEMPIRIYEFDSEEAAMARYNEINAIANELMNNGKWPSEVAEKPYAQPVRR